LPLAWIYFLPTSILLGLYVSVLRVRRSYTKFGKPSAISVEAYAALLAIPLSGFIATVGTSYGFYLLSQDDAPSRATGTNVLAVSLGLSLVLIIGLVRLIIRHQSGTDPLPFEPDVDPVAGMRATRQLRTRQSGGWLSGQARFAAQRANESLRYRGDEFQPTLREAITSVTRNTYGSRQLQAIVVAAFTWEVLAFTFGWRWWVVLGYNSASIMLLILASGLGGLARYFDQFRWARRESFLHQQLRRAAETKNQAVSANDLVYRIDVLTEEVKALRSDMLRAGARTSALDPLFRAIRGQ
jgi:hypothetical protein